MQKNSIFNFSYSYLNLPEKFHSITKISSFPKLETFVINKKLFKSLNILIDKKDDLANILAGKEKYNKSFSQAYAGHQFGNFTNLGDGRAIIIGEHVTKNKQLLDIQLKGSGITPYSRNGDGKATLKSMLREYIISEAMHNLNIPSSRSLAIISTGEYIYRQTKEKGAILARIMNSHIRVGTFEYASYLCSEDELKNLTTYTINRLYPELKKHKNPALALLNIVMEKQIDLIVNWMRVGFIHGVMNTDNTSIYGETFDYGPCAFINSYNPEKTYSSIDYNKRYSFGNQPMVLKWNISRFAESLIPIIHKNKEKSIELAQSLINQFDKSWNKKFYKMMLSKIGIKTYEKKLFPLIDELLDIMKKNKLDYTNTFLAISQNYFDKNILIKESNFALWIKKWKASINKYSSKEEAKRLMKKNNPFIIPRNHLVEEALFEAENGNLKPFQNLIDVIENPYKQRDNLEKFIEPPEHKFEERFQTFCGT